jgi:hypothetical protein
MALIFENTRRFPISACPNERRCQPGRRHHRSVGSQASKLLADFIQAIQSGLVLRPVRATVRRPVLPIKGVGKMEGVQFFYQGCNSSFGRRGGFHNRPCIVSNSQKAAAVIGITAQSDHGHEREFWARTYLRERPDVIATYKKKGPISGATFSKEAGQVGVRKGDARDRSDAQIG